MIGRLLLVQLVLVNFVLSERIWDVWVTTWNKGYLFTSLKPAPIDFGTPGPVGDANIAVDTTKYQQMDGFGASLTDSSALVLSNLKSANSSGYWSLLYKLFDPREAEPTAALSTLRIPMGASDFSASAYTFDDTWNDNGLSAFSLNSAPSYLWSTLADIKTVTPYLKLFILPWSAPAWMKTSGSLYGGQLKSGYEKTFAQYLLKCVQGMNSKGFRPYAVSLQNEPQNADSTYPTMLLPVSQAATVGQTLRSLLDSNNFTDVKIIGFEHNWDNAGTYPVQLMQQASSSFAGASFHCYAGSPSAQMSFINAYPSKGAWFTECTGTINTNWWNNVKWNMNNLFVGSVGYGSRAVMLWNLVGHANGEPRLPGTRSCVPGCRPVVSVDNNQWYLNEEFYVLAHSSRIVIPREKGGGFASRVGVSVTGNLASTLKVQAYCTPRANSSDWLKYGIVVSNSNDSGGGNPQPVSATIAFNSLQARYTFPVGVTTLWWYTPVQ